MAGEWREVPLEDVADELTVGYVGAMASEYVDDGIPFLRSLNVEPLRINRNGLKFITPDFHQRIQKSRLTPGDVVIVRTGKPGACSVVPDWLVEANCSDLVIVRCGNQLNNRFLAYYVNTVAYRHVAAHLVGAVQQHFNVGSARTLRLNLPPIGEQRAIAGVLGALDDKIEQNRRTARALERLARAIFRAWFVDFEPVKAKAGGAAAFPSMPQPVFDALPTRFVDSDIGPVPEGWEVKALYDTARYINGAAFRSKHFCNPADGVPVVKIAELKFGITGRTKFSNRSDLDNKYQIDTGELLYSWSGSPDTSLDTFLWTKGKGLLNQHIFRVVTSNASQKYFVYYLLRHLRQPLIEIARDKQTTGLGHVTVADMRRLKVCWPAAKVFEGFAQLVGPIFESSFNLMMESEKLAAMRDYLLPKLLSGSVRISGGRDAERLAVGVP